MSRKYFVDMIGTVVHLSILKIGTIRFLNQRKFQFKIIGKGLSRLTVSRGTPVKHYGNI
jgi:hypothetical protein